MSNGSTQKILDAISDTRSEFNSNLQTLSQNVREDVTKLHDKIDKKFEDLARTHTVGCEKLKLVEKDVGRNSESIVSLKKRPERRLGRIAIIVSILAGLSAVIGLVFSVLS